MTAEIPAVTAAAAYDQSAGLLRTAMQRGRLGDGPVYVRVERVEAVVDQLARLGSAAAYDAPTSGLGVIAAERERQIHVEGHDAEHDRGHERHELLRAAICYADVALDDRPGWSMRPSAFPPDWEWNPADPAVDVVRNLARAGALIAAEIDRRTGRG